MTLQDERTDADVELLREDPTGPPVFLPPSALPPPTGMARLRLTQLYRVGSVVLGLLLLVSIGQAVLALHQNGEARAMLVDRVDPAMVAQFELSDALGRQDDAIRAYAADGERARLVEYRQAVAEEANTTRRIRELLSDVPGKGPVLAGLDRLASDTAAWRGAFAEPIARGPGGGGLSPDSERSGTTAFTRVRSGNAVQQQALSTLHKKVADDLDRRARIAYWSVAAALIMVVLAALALALLIRRTVLTPVSSLSERVRAVAHGDFAHPMDVPGPAEIAELAAIIDAMRHRILDEWRVSSEARQMLNEQTAELRRSNKELEQFAYVASHDLQEPLRKVASFCQMLERRYGDQLDDRGRQYVEFAVDGAKRMQALINDLLSFSRVGRLSRTEDAVDLNAVVGQTLDDLSTLREETGARVTVADLPTVAGDRTQLGQLFLNLVGNAIKFRRPDVPPEVGISARRDGDHWEFACADNGIGIEPRYADRIFLIFQRLHPRDEYTGTGIGLALCKKIVEFHGGRIWLETEDRDGDAPGTTIRWTLPARPEPEPEPEGETEEKSEDDAG
ncbi:sensor histidine kinase [Actinomadura kijaniata]|uniref:sensor histidine kinase n=1 Tax=Actinomadura kijaniata TaxID=46161 RepID=UPI000A043EB2|nr:ATP-binding protein [Actinomadura kijaniata]